MNILFISLRDPDGKSQGGSQCTNRNYTVLSDLVGKKNIELINLTKDPSTSLLYKGYKFLNLLFLNYWGLTFSKIRHITSIAENYDIVFVDTSMYGNIASVLKRNKYKGKIICFFHNIEFKLRKEISFVNPFSLWEMLHAYVNEKNAIKYADIAVSLNQKDSLELQKKYGRRKITIIPITLPDISNPERIENMEQISVPPTLLFVGSYYYANVHGVKWFVKNVMPETDARLQIIGKGMGRLFRNLKTRNIEVFDYVEDISDYIINADFIISPVFKGSGMKVKICEALMYGKNIIGTEESFEGYDMDVNKTGTVCNTKEEFIKALDGNWFQKRTKYNSYSRNIFLSKYTSESVSNIFLEIINSK